MAEPVGPRQRRAEIGHDQRYLGRAAAKAALVFGQGQAAQAKLVGQHGPIGCFNIDREAGNRIAQQCLLLAQRKVQSGHLQSISCLVGSP